MLRLTVPELSTVDPSIVGPTEHNRETSVVGNRLIARIRTPSETERLLSSMVSKQNVATPSAGKKVRVFQPSTLSSFFLKRLFPSSFRDSSVEHIDRRMDNLATIFTRLKQAANDKTSGLIRESGNSINIKKLELNIDKKELAIGAYSVHDYSSYVKGLLKSCSPITDAVFDKMKDSVLSLKESHDPDYYKEINTLFCQSIEAMDQQEKTEFMLCLDTLAYCYQQASENISDKFNKTSVINIVAACLFNKVEDQEKVYGKQGAAKEILKQHQIFREETVKEIFTTKINAENP